MIRIVRFVNLREKVEGWGYRSLRYRGERYLVGTDVLIKSMKDHIIRE